MISSFFLKECWDNLKTTQKDISELRSDTKSMYTESEALQHERNDVAKSLITDRAIMRLEENTTVIKESLIDIKASNARVEKKIDEHSNKSFN